MCPRHPDRISYVRCQRCGRPACPECQRPAAVGIQCVDCVREAQQTARPVRSALGATLRPGSRPVVTLTIVVLCVVSYLLQRVDSTWTSRLAFAPFIGQDQPYRFLTAAFLHASIIHIAFNMYALWVMGPFLEQMLGRARFVALYLVSAVAGSVGVLALASPTSASWFTATVGASGAIFGVFGAIVPVLRRTGREAGAIVGLIAVNFVIGFVVSGIAWQAHLGGLVAGLVMGAAFAYAPKQYRNLVGWGTVVVVVAALVVIAQVKYAGV